MFCRTLIGAFALLLLSTPALGQFQNTDVRPDADRLTGTTLTESFTGVTHKGAYNFDARGRADNRFTEWHSEDGTILYREGDLMARGRWNIMNDAVCYDYDDERLSGGCFEVYKIGTCFYFYSRAVLAFAKAEDIYWTARSVHKGDRATCEAAIA